MRLALQGGAWCCVSWCHDNRQCASSSICAVGLEEGRRGGEGRGGEERGGECVFFERNSFFIPASFSHVSFQIIGAVLVFHNIMPTMITPPLFVLPPLPPFPSPPHPSPPPFLPAPPLPSPHPIPSESARQSTGFVSSHPNDDRPCNMVPNILHVAPPRQAKVDPPLLGAYVDRRIFRVSTHVI